MDLALKAPTELKKVGYVDLVNVHSELSSALKDMGLCKSIARRRETKRLPNLLLEGTD